MSFKRDKLPVFVFILTFIRMTFVQVKIERPMILVERFLKGSGWAEIFLISLTISLHAACLALARI